MSDHKKEAGSAVITLVGGASLACVLLAALLSLGSAVGRAAIVASIADQAALAAADALAGLVPGMAPCDAAGIVAAQNRVSVLSCELEGPAATVAVIDDAGIGVFQSSSRAGPSSLSP